MHKLRSAMNVWRDNRGLSTVEYVIILVLVAVGAIGVWNNFGNEVRGKVDSAAADIGGLEVKEAR